jgi:hypothetical protein
MKLKAITTVVFGLIATPVFAMGTSSGGGGVGVRCSLSDGSTLLETLDVHEARLKGLSFVRSPNSEGEAIELSSSVFAIHYFSGPFQHVDQYQDFLKKRFFERLFQWQPIEESDGKWISLQEVSNLPLSNDYGNYTIKPGCSLEQIAFFDDEKGVLKIDRRLFNQLDLLNQAVLFTHEMIYFMDRNYPSLHENVKANQSKTSEVSRAFVGKLFSDTPPKSKFRNFENTSFIICGNDLSRNRRKLWI